MSLKNILDNAVNAQRQEALKTSPQLTVGEIILLLKPIVEKYKEKPEEDQPEVYYDFEYLYPTELDSWRGIYAELALNFTARKFPNNKQEPLTVSEFLSLMEGSIGTEYGGYKGGTFRMSKHTPVWVANYGNAGQTAVVGIVDYGYQVVVKTAMVES
jgi:hypothetical protein